MKSRDNKHRHPIRAANDMYLVSRMTPIIGNRCPWTSMATFIHKIATFIPESLSDYAS